MKDIIWACRVPLLSSRALWLNNVTEQLPNPSGCKCYWQPMVGINVLLSHPLPIYDLVTGRSDATRMYIRIPSIFIHRDGSKKMEPSAWTSSIPTGDLEDGVQAF